MPDIDPYRPSDPIADDKRPQASRQTGLANTAAFVLLPILFGITGFAGYIALALSLERQPSQNEPMLSHGQQAALISLPICTIIAASAGLALAFAYAGRHVTSIVLLFITSLVGWLVTRSLWNAQIAQYGRDPSEAVLYYPPSGYAAGTACLAMLLAIFVILRRPKSGEPSNAPESASRVF